MKKFIYKALMALLLFVSFQSNGQIDRLRNLPNLNRSSTGGGTTGGVKTHQTSNDTLKHRTGLEDSITIHFRYLDSSALYQFDSSIIDFNKRIPLPPQYYHLGNFGNAAKNYLFEPILRSGWDAGFHVFDIYRFTIHDTRFFNTTRPYSETSYMLGSRSEQMIILLHSQNIKPNWNFALQYRLINSPGYLQNQNTNHNNYRFNSWYQSKNKRYSNFFIIVANRLNSAESGGIQSDINYLDNTSFKDRSGIPVQLGKQSQTSRNFFSTKIPTGNKYIDDHILLRQQYDLGQKDSIVLDTTVVPLFYPRLRLEHTFTLSHYTYRFEDAETDSPAFYLRKYGFDSSFNFFMQDRWQEILNDFSIYTFPDKKNPQQFLKLGATFQNLTAKFDSSKAAGEWKRNLYNFFAHGEYRNRTKNQRWDIEAFGNLYLAGYNAGDYDGYVSLQGLLSKRLGSLQMGFRNVSRTPSFIFNPTSSFWKEKNIRSFKKENIAMLFGALQLPALHLRLSGQYFLVSNYTYFSDYNERAQASAIFNVLQLSAEKATRIYRNWIWRTTVVVQQQTANSPLHLPLLFTRNIIGYEGKLGYRNLIIAFGLEVKYHTDYKNNGYSPLMGQFFEQDTVRLNRNLPELHSYIHLRIRTFTAYLRAENLNTLRFMPGNVGFTNNNLLAPDYPGPGLVIRLGIFWSFVN